MTHSELDVQFVQGLRLLHSAKQESMDQLRNLLDEAIKQRHGLSKMLSNVLHKKYTMEDPVLSDHSSTSSKKSKSSSSSSKHSIKSNKSDSPEEIIIARDTSPPDMLTSDDPLAEILEDDLTCVVCKGMDVGARNRLVECADCHSLYHQECHTPHIQDSQIDVPKLLWYCSNCIKAHQPIKEKTPVKSAIEGKKENKKSTQSSKHSDKYKTTSTHLSASSETSSNSKLTPNINIVTGDRRMKEVAKKSKADKRSGSTSSSSKYSSSSSKNSEKSSRKND